MKIIFNFGGFYNSILSDEIEDYVETMEYDFDKIDFNKTHKNVAKDIVNVFNLYLYDEFDIKTNLKFVSLESPRYYNYTTDKIVLEISDKDLKTLDSLLKSDEFIFEEFKAILKDDTTSKSGYIPFYNYDKVMAKIGEENRSFFYQVLLDTLINGEVGENYNNFILENLEIDLEFKIF